MNLTTTEIENILDDAPDGESHYQNHYENDDKEIESTIHALSDLREILQLRQQVERLEGENDKLLSKYGDNWYDGFMAAKSYEQKKGNGLVSDLTDSEILNMSEHAESAYVNQLRENQSD